MWRLASVLAAVSLAATFFPPELAAHHSFSAYDTESVATVSGTVVGYRWSNPHVMLDVRDAQAVVWRIETDAPATMASSGWAPDTYSVGDAVTVRMNPARDAGSASGLLLAVRGANGVSRSSVARTGQRAGIASHAIALLALSIAVGVAIGYRRHRAAGATGLCAAGAGLVAWTAWFGFSVPAQVLGVGLLLVGAAWAGRASVRAAGNGENVAHYR